MRICRQIGRRAVLGNGLALAAPAVLQASGVRAQTPGGSVWIVTAGDATLGPSSTTNADRAITRGPAIRLVSPTGTVPANAPFDFRIEFAARGGEKIAPASVQVVLLRGNDIDITSRLKPYVSPAGIAIPNALVPPGKFVLQVAVSDGSDRRTTANVEINAQ